jgi:hypothetical protein
MNLKNDFIPLIVGLFLFYGILSLFISPSVISNERLHELCMEANYTR